MSWIGTAVVGGLTLGTAGMITSATAGRDKVQNDFLQNPEFPHSQDARDLWWGKLQDWGKDPNYGAISPDWDNIWSTVQNRVKQYYEGGPLAPGVQDKVNSSLARRGMSENPGSDFLHAQVAAQEGGDLRDAATQQGIAKAQFAETGRQNWLTSLDNFQAQKPTGQWSSQQNPNNQRMVGNAIGQIGGAVGSAGIAAGSAPSGSWLDELTQGNKAPTTYDNFASTFL